MELSATPGTSSTPNSTDIVVQHKANSMNVSQMNASKPVEIHKLIKCAFIIVLILFVVFISILCAICISQMNTNRELIDLLKNSGSTTITDESTLNSAVNNKTSETYEKVATCNNASRSLYISSKQHQPLKLWHHSLPQRILPGVQFLSYSFNQLQGSPPTDLILQGNYRQIIEFTYLGERVSSGSDDFLVPDQLDLPSISGVCSKESSTSSVSSATSVSSMFTESAESTGQKSFSASISASGWGVSMSGSVAMSASYSNSRSSTASKQQSRAGKTSSSYTYSKALLYSTQLRWDTIDSYRDPFIDAINAIQGSNNYNDVKRNTVIFFGDFGTHVLDLAKMGARCRKVTYFQSTMSSEALSHGSSAANSNSQSQSYSGSVSGGGWGFSVSASAAFSQSSSNSYQHSSESSSESSLETEYSSETLDCVGEVDVTTICGDMLGTKNQPSLVGYRMKRIWDLPVFDEYPLAKQNILMIIQNISDSGIECGINNCGGLGMCGIDESFWTLLKYKDSTNDYTFDALWQPATCFDQYQIGTSLMKSGTNIYTQMNQCNDSSIVNWGERYESSQVSFDPFCSNEYGIQVALGLNLVNLSVSFDVAIEASSITDYGFSITYGLLSTGDYVCNSIGGVSYALFCENTNVRVTTLTVEAEYILVETKKNWANAEQYCIDNYDSHLASLFNEEIFDKLKLNIDDTNYWIGLNDVATESKWVWTDCFGLCGSAINWQNAKNWQTEEPNNGLGYAWTEDCGQIRYKNNAYGYNDADCDATYPFICNQNSIIVKTSPILNCKDNVEGKAIAAINGYNYTSTAVGASENLEYYSSMGIIDATSIDKSSVQIKYDAVGGLLTFDVSVIHFCYDTSAIRYDHEEFEINKNVKFNSPYVKRKWVRFDPSLQCTAVNIFVGFTYFDGYNKCSHAVWTENTKGGGGFTLVVAAWETRGGTTQCTKSVGGRYPIVRVSWFATCQKF